MSAYSKAQLLDVPLSRVGAYSRGALVEKIEAFLDNGSLLFGSLLPVILEGHVLASIEGKRVL